MSNIVKTVTTFFLCILISAIASGVDINQLGIVGDLTSDAQANKAQELGVGWVRIAVRWHEVEFAQNSYDWGVPDVEINRATNRGINIFLTLSGTPSWANGGNPNNYPPSNSVDFADFCTAIANRYKNNTRVKAYGMWNEPNLEKFWHGESASAYKNKILVPGSQAIKTVKSSLLVGAPELTHGWYNDSTNAWKLGTILDTPGAIIDVATQHYYPDANISFQSFLDNHVNPQRRSKPVWITEIGTNGCPSNLCSLDSQAHYYTNILGVQAARATWFQKIFPYRLWDPQGTCTGGNGAGITYGSPITEKPAFGT